jgi:hypothetical protein
MMVSERTAVRLSLPPVATGGTVGACSGAHVAPGARRGSVGAYGGAPLPPPCWRPKHFPSRGQTRRKQRPLFPVPPMERTSTRPSICIDEIAQCPICDISSLPTRMVQR